MPFPSPAKNPAYSIVSMWGGGNYYPFPLTTEPLLYHIKIECRQVGRAKCATARKGLENSPIAHSAIGVFEQPYKTL